MDRKTPERDLARRGGPLMFERGLAAKAAVAFVGVMKAALRAEFHGFGFGVLAILL